MKILIADDDGLIRDALKILFETKAGWSAHTACDGQEAYEKCAGQEPDVILMDIRMPVCDGVMATRRIKKDFSNVKIIILTTFSDEAYIAQALSAGADGYLLKSTPADGIIERINAVKKGAFVFDKGVNITAANPAAESAEGHGMPRVPSPTELPANPMLEPRFSSLTDRENEILSLVATGLSNNEIAAKLFLSAGTVRNAVSVILEKLEMRDRTQLAVYYWKNL